MRKHQRIRVLFAPRLQRHLIRLGKERQRIAGVAATDRVQLTVLVWIPHAFRLAVIQQKCAVVGIAGCAKRRDFAVNFSSVDHGPLHERSPSNGDRFAAHDIVNQLVTVHRTDGIRLRLAVVDSFGSLVCLAGLVGRPRL